MIQIKQTQRKIKVSTQALATQAKVILQYLDYADFDLGIWLTTNKTIQKYNHEYRHKNESTDILSFPFHPELQAGKRIKIKSDDDKNLGDLIISVPFVLANKKQLPGSFETRMQRLLVHGICHLLGYDHIQDNDYKKMLSLENKIIAYLQDYFKN